MKHYPITSQCRIGTARAFQLPSSTTTNQQRRPSLRVRPCNSTSSRIASVVVGPVEAVTAEKEHVGAFMDDQAWCFDQWAVRIVTVENLDWVTGGCHAVGFEPLEQDGRGVGVVAITACPATAERIAVDFVDDVESAVGVGETSRINGTTSAENMLVVRAKDLVKQFG